MLQACSKDYQHMFKDIPPIEGKKVVETTSRELFYKVVDNVFYLPPISYIRKNLDELRTLEESFLAYYYNEIPQYYDWENLKTAYYDEAEDSLVLLDYLATKKEIALDIESRNTTFHDNELLLIGFTWDEDIAATIRGFTPKVIDKLQWLFGHKDIKFIWQGGKFDISKLKQWYDLDVRIDEDTMYLHYIGFNENRGTHDLETLAMVYLQAPDWKSELDRHKKDICRDKKIKAADFTYDMFPDDILIPYAHKDTIATFRLYKLFKKMFPKDKEFIYYKVIEAANVFAEIERVGVYVNQERIDELDNHLSKEIERVEEEINEITHHIWDPEIYKAQTGAKSAPERFNIRSSQQLKWVLDQLDISVPDTGEKTLKRHEGKHEIIYKILEIRKLNKYHKTYVKGLKRNIEKDGRIHTSFNLHGTATGRLSSSGPNLQNIPRDKTIKNIFSATPGYNLTQADYSQAELRVLAVLSNDPWLKSVYINGEDLHDRVAEQYWGKNFTSEQRVKAKTVNFGIAYGRTEHTLAEGLNISKNEAKKLLVDWYKPMPTVKKFMNGLKRKALKGGPVSTPFKRERRFIVTKKNKWHIQNEAMNMPIQSTASDLTLFSLLEIHKELTERKLGRIVLTVHDSIIVENKPEYNEEVAEVMTRHMVETPIKYLNTDVPFAADIDHGFLWGELD